MRATAIDHGNFGFANGDFSSGRALPFLKATSSISLDDVAMFFLSVFVFSIPWDEEAPLAIPHGETFSRFLGIAAFAFGLLAVAARFRVRRLSAAHYPMFAFVGWSALTSLWTISLDLTSERLFSYVQLAMMAWLCWEIAARREQQIVLLRSYVLGTCVSSFGTIMNFIHGHAAISGGLAGLERGTEVEQGRYVATGFNENELCLILALSIPISCYLIASARSKWWMAIYAAHLLGTGMAIILTGSRGGLLSTLVALSIFPLLSSQFTKGQKLGALSAAAILTVVVVSVVPKATWDRLLSTTSELERGTLTKRTIIWQAGLEVFRDHPYVGVGAGSYSEAVSPLLDVPYAAHNTFLSILVDTGVIGAAIFVLWAIALCYCVQPLRSIEKRLWTVLLLTWMVGVSAMTWEHRKTTWWLFGMVIAASGTSYGQRYTMLVRRRQGS